MRIGIMGDTHGNTGWVKYALGKFKRENCSVILQLGDFGVWPGERGGLFARDVNNKLNEYEQELLVVPGNHEDWTKINSLPEYEDGWLSFRDNIKIAPRGHRWEMGGRTFVALGGAPSVDRSIRLHQMGLLPVQDWKTSEEMLAGRAHNMRQKQSWWPEEQITEEDVAKVIDGGYADIFVAHDAPHGVTKIERNIGGNPHGFFKEDLEYAEVGRERMTRAFQAVQPKLFLHGHYHFWVNEKVGESQVVGLGCDAQNFSLGVVETDDMTAEIWDVWHDYKQNAR